MFKKSLISILGSGILLSACEDNDTKKCLSLSQDKGISLLAEDFCERAAQNGDAEAQRLFAETLLHRNEKEQAIEFLQKSANQKNGEAMYRLAELYSDDEQKAKFYYENSCQNGILKGCEQLHSLNDKTSEELENTRRKIEQEADARIKAEQEKLSQQQKEEQKKLAIEREQLNQEKAKIVKADSLFMTKAQVEDTYKEVIKIVSANGDGANQALMNWVENCYVRSAFKLGCFHFDLWISILDERISQANNKEVNPYFGDSRVRNRALRNVPILQNITTSEFNRVVSDARHKLAYYEHIFFDLWKKEDARRSNQVSSSTSSSSFIGTLNGFKKYEQNGLWGFTDSQGNVVIPAQYLAVGGFYEGRAVVQVPNTRMWGYIDTNGRWVVSPEFCMAGRFSEGLAGAYKNGYWIGDECVGGKWGYLNTSGHWAINPIFDSATMFKNGKAKVTYKGSTGYINNKGNWAQ